MHEQIISNQKTSRSPSQAEAEDDNTGIRGARGRYVLWLLASLLLAAALVTLLVGAELLAHGNADFETSSRHDASSHDTPYVSRTELTIPSVGNGDDTTNADPNPNAFSTKHHTQPTTDLSPTGAIGSTFAGKAAAMPVAIQPADTTDTSGSTGIDNYDDDNNGNDSDTVLNKEAEEACFTIFISTVCTVTCKKITTEPPGLVAADFITNKAISYCNDSIIQLIFECCYFPERKIQKGWFTIDNETIQPLITVLSIRSSPLDYIGDDAFQGFKYLTQVEITGGEVLELPNSTYITSFIEYTDENSKYSLHQNGMNDQMELRSEENSHENVASLDSFQMLQTFNVENLLQNITTTEISTVEIVDLRYNPHLNTLRSSYFRIMKKIKALHFTNSCVSKIEPDTFTRLEDLRLLHLDGTNLQTLDEGIIPNHLFNESSFLVYLGNNPWDCTCSIAWLSDKIKSNPRCFGVPLPICKSPHAVNGTPLNKVDFSYCKYSTTTLPDISTSEGTTENQHELTSTESTSPHSTSDISFTSEVSKTTTTTDNTTLTPVISSTTFMPDSSTTLIPETTTVLTLIPRNISDCIEAKYRVIIHSKKVSHFKRNALYPREWNENNETQKGYPPTNADFSVYEEKGDLVVDVGNVTEANDKKWSLIWIDSDGQCYIHLFAPSQLLIHGLNAGKTYVLCLLFGELFEASPFNCKAVTMIPPYESRAWIVNSEKPYVIGMFSAIIIVVGIILMIIMYALISRFPELLKRNKRVVIVNYQNTKALVLPEDYKSSSNKRKNSKKTSKDLSTDSSVSNTTVNTTVTTPRSSTTTYVSVNEPSEEELTLWRIQNMFDKQTAKEKRKMKKENGSGSSIERPPSPPDRISSISWKVETKESTHISSA